jgi:hypothetical protein
MDAMDPHENEAQARLERLKAQLDALAELACAQALLQQTQAALDPARLTTTVAQVRRWAEVETHPNWVWAAYADVAQRLTRVEDRLDEMTDSRRMILGQLAALERQERTE